MKKVIYLLMWAFVFMFTIQATELYKRRDGTDPGHTGSPGDSLKTCIVCHGGTLRYLPGWISSNIPETGYKPGQKYSFTAFNKEMDYNRFGFQISPQALNGNLLGTLVRSDTVKTKLVGNGKYITYSQYGIDSKDSMIWNFDWIAPDAASGIHEVTFYGAFNSNLDGHKFSEYTTTSRLTVYQEGFTGTAETKAWMAAKPYPNPCNEQVFIDVPAQYQNEVQVALFNLNGQEIETTSWVQTGKIAVQLENIKPGIYFLELSYKDQQQRIKILHQ